MDNEKEDLKKQKEMAVMRMAFIRSVLGITQAELAAMIGCSLSYVKKIETGTRPLTVNYLRVFCLAVGVSADYVLFGEI